LKGVFCRFKSRNADPSIGGECDDSCKKNILCEIVTTLYTDNDQCDRFSSLYDQ
jgi:hypothetical protein